MKAGLEDTKAALLVIVVGSFGTYHWIALGAWAALGLVLWLARRARSG